MHNISCLVVDDEPLALKLIRSYVEKTHFLELRGTCSNAFEVMERLEQEPVDLLFLDIQMPDLNGMELIRTLARAPKVIFTTAFSEYAIDGFKVDAVDYLLKPFNYEEFLRAANKAKERILSSARQAAASKDHFIFVKSEYKQLKIDLGEVLYFEGLKDYVKIWISGQSKPVLTLMSLKTLEEELPREQFMRVHRSFIVSLDKIEAIDRGQILINKEYITVADQYKERFQAYISNRSIH